jgi:hypothetical protein
MRFLSSLFSSFFLSFFALCFFFQASAEEFDLGLPEGYELASIEEEGIEFDDTQLAKSLFKPAKDTSDSNAALATLEAGPSAVVANCVNAITGDFFDSQVSLVIPGPQPLVVQSSYCSSEKEWHFQHMPHMEAGLSNGQHHLYVRYSDEKEAIAGSGRYVSADGRKAFRMGVNDILGKHSGGPHVNFEVLVPNPKEFRRLKVEENIHVYLTD